ncbi:VWA domain-containing protein [Flavobacterium sp.]|jgi:Ca-activated chloride channel family protein|uniref:VWA domain-containing protein n=1 Tax=Flavobacterium sp. TaxID=239 RepID=UPI0037BFB584
MFEFESPYYFILVLLLPIGLVAQKAYVKWQTEKQAVFSEPQALEKLLVNSPKQISRIKFMLQIMAVFFIVLALVNPKLGSKVETVPSKGVEIVFAIDVSKSMLCKDIQPNRLEKSKQIMTQMIESIGSDRIGIVAYAGSAYPVLPMTTDYELAKMFTQSINTNLISSQGTAIESAIQTSVDFFDNPTSGKAIILFSDGEDHQNASFDISKVTKEKNVKIITVGVGTANGGTIEFEDELGFQQVKKDKNGQVVITKLNQEILQKIASETNGTYCNDNQISKVVASIKSALASVKQQEFKAQELAQKQSQFQWFLGIAFLLLLLEFFITNSNLNIKNWFSKHQAHLFLLVFLTSGMAFSQEKNTDNSQQKEKQLRWIKAKEKKQKQPAEYNLGNTIYKNKKYVEAISNYKNAALLANTSAQKHKAYHNLGNAYMQDKNYKLAVASYKNALKANAKDEKTRYNLALAKKLLKKYPPKPNPKNKNKKKNQKDKKQQDKKDNKNKEKSQPKKPSANKQRMDNVLKAISNEEKKVQEKVNANKTKTNTTSTEKDW